jgi:membrane-associated phospholipid phosphatase
LTRGVIFGDVIAPAITDFARLPSRETATWLGVGAALALVAHSVDGATSTTLSSATRLDPVLDHGAVIGGARAQLIGAAATYMLGRTTRQHTMAALGADLLRAQIVAQTLTGTIKLAVQRGRPDGTHYSFPSGHSSVSFATATVLQRRFGWKAGLPAYAMAGYVAASRVQDRRHYLSDVAFGAAIGMVAGRTVTLPFGGEHRVTVSPTVTRGGGGVSFTLAD